MKCRRKSNKIYTRSIRGKLLSTGPSSEVPITVSMLYVSSLQTIKPRHPRKSHSSSEKSQENPEHAQLLPVVSEWAPNPRVALGGRAMDYRAAWPEQGSPRGCRLIKAPLQLPWTFLFLLLQFIWHSLGLLIHSHLGGKKKKKVEMNFLQCWLFFQIHDDVVSPGMVIFFPFSLAWILK